VNCRGPRGRLLEEGNRLLEVVALFAGDAHLITWIEELRFFTPISLTILLICLPTSWVMPAFRATF